MGTVGHCTFCGQVHELGDARTDANCGEEVSMFLWSELRTPLDERLERTDFQEDP